MLIHPWLVLATLSLEAAVGYPRWLYRLIRHPVVWIGGAIGMLERGLNRPGLPFTTRRLLGVGVLVLICALAGSAGWAVQAAPLPAPAVGLIVVMVAASGLAQRSLYDHVAVVALNFTPVAAFSWAAMLRSIHRVSSSVQRTAASRAPIEYPSNTRGRPENSTAAAICSSGRSINSLGLSSPGGIAVSLAGGCVKHRGEIQRSRANPSDCMAEAGDVQTMAHEPC